MNETVIARLEIDRERVQPVLRRVDWNNVLVACGFVGGLALAMTLALCLQGRHGMDWRSMGIGALVEAALFAAVVAISRPLIARSARRWADSLDAVLTDRRLRIAQGASTRVVESIPLDAITDVEVVQSAVERRHGVASVLIKTGGHEAEGAIPGLRDAEKVQELILEARHRARCAALGIGQRNPF
jgi:membrane protein YdbS with pleckstrin-like domain